MMTRVASVSVNPRPPTRAVKSMTGMSSLDLNSVTRRSRSSTFTLPSMRTQSMLAARTFASMMSNIA